MVRNNRENDNNFPAKCIWSYYRRGMCGRAFWEINRDLKGDILRLLIADMPQRCAVMNCFPEKNFQNRKAISCIVYIKFRFLFQQNPLYLRIFLQI